jgi:hypothetical protein
MRYMLAISLNGIAQIEYDRDVPLDAKQADYLDNIDNKMGSGIQVSEKTIANSSPEQKIEMNLSSQTSAMQLNI